MGVERKGMMMNWIASAKQAAEAAGSYVDALRAKVAVKVTAHGRFDPVLAEREQRLVHGFAWYATVAESLKTMCQWADRAHSSGEWAAIDALVLKIGVGEYCAQLASGVAMSQSETVRPAEFEAQEAASQFAAQEAIAAFLAQGNTAEHRAELARRLADGERPFEGFGDETLDLIRAQFRNFTADRITPRAHGWHLADDLIPQEIIAEMAELGVFGVCIDEEYGGLGLGKLAMSLVSEELSRGWICAGSLGTRSEIAGELIGENGTDEQRRARNRSSGLSRDERIRAELRRFFCPRGWPLGR